MVMVVMDTIYKFHQSAAFFVFVGVREGYLFFVFVGVREGYLLGDRHHVSMLDHILLVFDVCRYYYDVLIFH